MHTFFPTKFAKNSTSNEEVAKFYSEDEKNNIMFNNVKDVSYNNNFYWGVPEVLSF